MSAVHELVLQPDSFYLCFDVDRPTSKAGFIADELYNQFKGKDPTDEAIIAVSNKIGYYKDKMNNKRISELRDKCKNYWRTRAEYEKNLDTSKTPIYLDPKSRERVLECISALKRNSSIQSLLHPEGILETPISENEQAILLDVEIRIPKLDSFILRLKAKVDNYTVNRETNTIVINDVKTIGKVVSEFSNNFDKFHYYRELSLYSWLMTLVAKKFYKIEDCIVQSNCLVVSTIPEYYTKVYQLSKADFIKGWKEFKFLLKLVAHYYSKGYRFE